MKPNATATHTRRDSRSDWVAIAGLILFALPLLVSEEPLAEPFLWRVVPLAAYVSGLLAFLFCRHRRFAAALLASIAVLFLVAAGVLRLFPDSFAANAIVARPIPFLLYCAPVIGISYILSLPALALAVIGLAIKRGRVSAALALTAFVQGQIALLLPLGLYGAVVLFDGAFAATATVLSVVAIGAGVARSWGVSRTASAAVCGLAAAVALSPVAAQIQSRESDGPAAKWNATRYFPPGSAYDAHVLSDTDLLVALGHGGGLFHVEHRRTTPATTPVLEDLNRSETICACAGRLYLTNNAFGDSTIPDLYGAAAGTPEHWQPVFLPDHHKICDVACDERTGRLFLLDEDTPSIAVLDAATGTLAAAVELEPGGAIIDPIEIALDENRRRLYAVCWVAGRDLYEVDVDALRLVRKKTIGTSATDVAADPSRGVLYIARPLHRRLDVLAPDTLERVSTIAAPPGVRQLLTLDDGELIAMGGFSSGELIVADTAQPARRATVRGFKRIRELRYGAASDEILVCAANGVFGVPMEPVRRELEAR